ncbi:nucleotidyltransferase family protein [Maribacter halichondriae]|uniref:nucleotidyltransferase family protein n=1 Tax=Maribacter halichondriae TaxID=2980554 RepID=UPI0023583C3A|nr:nucleotidyltransferase family protein [Maribacter sp. Hal144]
MNYQNDIAILILAAGKSSRMGKPKQLLAWKNTTLLGHAIKNAKAICPDHVYVVLGANTEEIKKSVEDTVHFIFNENYERGLGSSVATGIGSILKTNKKYQGVLITLCDQPLIDIDYLNQIITSYGKDGSGIIATAYINRAGVPTLFDKRYFDELSLLDEDFGASQMIRKYQKDVKTLDPKGKALDIDTWDDYIALI